MKELAGMSCVGTAYMLLSSIPTTSVTFFGESLSPFWLLSVVVLQLVAAYYLLIERKEDG